jgi:hypothetical protein
VRPFNQGGGKLRFRSLLAVAGDGLTDNPPFRDGVLVAPFRDAIPIFSSGEREQNLPYSSPLLRTGKPEASYAVTGGPTRGGSVR